MELYAVFSSPLLYKVMTEAGYIVGSLEQTFVDKLVIEMSSFLLSGRAWTVIHINYQERIVRVTPAPGGKKPTWGGFAPQLLSFQICQQIATILKSNNPIPYIHPTAQAALEEYRADFSSLLNRPSHSIKIEPDRVFWWTFAGGQINQTLKYGIQFQEDWKIVTDNFGLRIEGNKLTPQSLNAAVTQMSTDDEFWCNPSSKHFIRTQLPEYRLSKFQIALPADYCAEMISNYLLDIPGTVQFLQRV